MEQLAIADTELDTLQTQLSEMEAVECPLKHVFLPGMYIRKIFMPAYTLNSHGERVQTVIISKIHKTHHTYHISKGKCAVYNKADEFLGVVEAPFFGLTIPGTRRVLVIIEDCHWATTHLLDYITGEENDWDEERKAELMSRIEADLIEEHHILITQITDNQ